MKLTFYVVLQYVHHILKAVSHFHMDRSRVETISSSRPSHPLYENVSVRDVHIVLEREKNTETERDNISDSVDVPTALVALVSLPYPQVNVGRSFHTIPKTPNSITILSYIFSLFLSVSP